MSRKIQIPNNVICSKNINHLCFYLYYTLKKISYNNKVSIKSKDLRELLGWKKTETLKKYLNILKQEDAISYDFDSIPKHQKMEITLPKLKNNFTQTLKTNIDMIEEKVLDTSSIPKYFKEMAIRLYYYYLKNTNSNLGVAFPSYRAIYNETKVNQLYIASLNEFLVDVGLLRIIKGGWNIVDNINGIYKQAPNQYKVK